MASNTKEKVIENKIKLYLKNRKYYFFKNHGNMLTEHGRPDIVSCVNGKFVAIEVKREKGGIQSEAQKVHQKNIENNGGIYILANSLECVTEVLEEE